MIKYAIIGAGWRSEFYLRIACLCPDKFTVSGIYIRNEEKREIFANKYNVRIFDTLDGLLSTDFDFVVSCVNKDGINDMVRQLTKKGVPVLTETPVTDATLGGKVQVAEQFHFMPRNLAYKKIIDSGIIGKVHQVQLSCCHFYHAASLIRFFLETGFEEPEVTTHTLNDTVTRYNSRNGYLTTPILTDSEQTIKIFKFDGKSAVYDFTYEQYFSDIRSSRIVIRGENGEIVDNTCTYLSGGVPQSFEIKRNQYGSCENLDGMCLFNIVGNDILYTNPFPTARLSDEEIAIATCLTSMKKYLETNQEFYSVQDAAFDAQMMQL